MRPHTGSGAGSRPTSSHSCRTRVTFSPTDAPLLALLMLLIFFSIFLMTALAGRVWCGWGCPQTVYMEFLYRPLERLFEGSYTAQQRLDREGMNAQRVLKFMTFLAVSFFVANTFLAYFVGTERLLRWVTHSPLEHPGAFGIMAVTTALMTFDFGYFREQMCTVACPYGRFQSVLLDRQSMIVSYDAGRGEPRGKRRKNAPADAAPVGDCVDCRACVITCPTGIDIRKGLQMECIACGLCVDACNEIMDKVGLPRGLVRYDTERHLKLRAQGIEEKFKIIRPRTIYYAGVLAVVGGIMLYALITRAPLELHVLHDRNPLYVQLSDGEIRNGYILKILNKTHDHKNYNIKVAGLENAKVDVKGAGDLTPDSLYVQADSVGEFHIFVSAPVKPGEARPVVFTLTDNATEKQDVYESVFISERPRG